MITFPMFNATNGPPGATPTVATSAHGTAVNGQQIALHDVALLDDALGIHLDTPGRVEEITEGSPTVK